MTVDQRITQAINEAVAEAGQPETLASRLNKWFEVVASGNEDIGDPTVTARRLETLFEGTNVADLNSDKDEN